MPRPDTIIVGAGLAGASVAARLPGPSLVVDQAPQPGAEASAQNAGMVRLLVEDPVERRLALRAESLLAALDEHWPDPPSTVTGGLLALVHDPAHLDDGVAHLRLAGIPVEAIDHPAEVAPALAGARTARAWWLPTA
ncbi:MAG: FAD-binding oxidoreductase, partial [Deltaproteobacteria bacterium]